MNHVVLDAVNWRILALLQANARISFSEIGRQVGLTPTAVAERVRHLEDARIIRKYGVDLRPEELGYAMTVFIRVAVRPGASAQLARLVASMPEVLECHRVTGDDCYVMKAHVRDVVHLEEVIDRFAVLGQTTTSIVQSSPVPVRWPVLHDGAQLTAVS